jgi:HAD superfamily hydrolase (TIGR01509 family)
MPAILFGSIGTIADTSELQRQAFNQAFALHDLDWNWSRSEYMNLLETSGGSQRIEDYATSLGQSVNATAIHQSKSEIFQAALGKERVEPRPGVVVAIQTAQQQGFKLAWVTTTSKQNVDSILGALRPEIDASMFDLVLNSSAVKNSKPAPDAYDFAVRELGQTPQDCIAIENNLDGLKAARAAGLACVAFPDANTIQHNFDRANLVVDRLNFQQLQDVLHHNL